MAHYTQIHDAWQRAATNTIKSHEWHLVPIRGGGSASINSDATIAHRGYGSCECRVWYHAESSDSPQVTCSYRPCVGHGAENATTELIDRPEWMVVESARDIADPNTQYIDIAIIASMPQKEASDIVWRVNQFAHLCRSGYRTQTMFHDWDKHRVILWLPSSVDDRQEVHFVSWLICQEIRHKLEKHNRCLMTTSSTAPPATCEQLHARSGRRPRA